MLSKGNIIKYQNPSSPLINRVNKSKANFVKRLLDPNRKVIQNWVNPLDVSTHKLGWATEDTKQGAFVYPEVQEINGELIDFTHPSHLRSEGMNSAIERRDTVRMTPEQAKWFTENYKEYYPGFKDGGILKAQEGTGNLYAPHPLSPVGIALNQAKIMAKMKGEQQHLPPGVKEVVGPDGKKIVIRTEQPLQPLEQNIAEWLPGTGDVAELGYVANDVKNGNLGSAALAAGLMVLPGNARKILDKFGVDLGDINTFARLSDQEWDDMYFQAIDSGDMDLVQTIRDAHFKVKAPNTKAVDSDGNPIKLFHGEKDSPTYHDLRYLNSGPDHKGLGVYYSSSSNDIAKTYAQHKGGPTGQVREVYYNIKNPNVVDAEGRSFQTVLIEEGAYGSKTGVSTDQLVNRTYWDKAPEGYRKKSDKDGLIIQNVEDHAPGWTGSSKDAIADNYVTWNPYAVKSAEAVVRHPKTGEIIPLS